MFQYQVYASFACGRPEMDSRPDSAMTARATLPPVS